MKQLLAIFGSTSAGKTDLALKLAKKFNGELVACDSRQVYVGLDIGTGKLPSGRWKMEDGRWKKGRGYWEMDGVRIWMYDVADPKKQYTVYDYVKDANKVIDEILKRNKLPIIVGGTGLYLKALFEGLPNLAIPIDQKLRNKLEKLSLDKLQKKLQEVSLQKWEKMNYSDRKNPRRLVRAIEIATSVDINTTAVGLMSTAGRIKLQADVLKIGLTAPKKILYQRIDERVVSRLDQGMIKEARSLQKNGLSLKRMRQLGLEYGVLADYLESKIIGVQELIKLLEGKIHRFARRQITWFKNPSASSGRIYWFDVTGKGFADKVENLIAKWYDNHTTYAAKN